MLFSACQHDLLKNKIKMLRGVGETCQFLIGLIHEKYDGVTHEI